MVLNNILLGLGCVSGGLMNYTMKWSVKTSKCFPLCRRTTCRIWILKNTKKKIHIYMKKTAKLFPNCFWTTFSGKKWFQEIFRKFFTFGRFAKEPWFPCTRMFSVERRKNVIRTEDCNLLKGGRKESTGLAAWWKDCLIHDLRVDNMLN